MECAYSRPAHKDVWWIPESFFYETHWPINVVSSHDHSHGYNPPPPASADQEQAPSTKTLFLQYCQDCPGPQRDGRGALRPFLEQDLANLTSQMTQAKTDQELFSIIRKRGGEMHGWTDTFTDQQVLDLVHYLRALSPYTFSPTASL